MTENFENAGSLGLSTERRKYLAEAEKAKKRNEAAARMAGLRKIRSEEEKEKDQQETASRMAAMRKIRSKEEKEKERQETAARVAAMRKNQAEAEKEKVRQETAARVAAMRKNQAEAEKEKVRQETAARVAAMRKNQAEAEKEKVRQETAARVAAMRKNQAEAEKEKVREENTARMAEMRKIRSKEEKEKERQETAARVAAMRKNQAEAEKEKVRQETAARVAAMRKNQAEAEKEKVRQETAARVAAMRKNQAEAEKEKVRQETAARVAAMRKNQAEAEKEKVRQETAARVAAMRKNQAEAEKEKVREENTARMAEMRKIRSKEEKEKERQETAARVAAMRKNQAEAEKEKVRQETAARVTAMRKNQAEAEKEKAREDDARDKRLRREAMTAEERAAETAARVERRKRAAQAEKSLVAAAANLRRLQRRIEWVAAERKALAETHDFEFLQVRAFRIDGGYQHFLQERTPDEVAVHTSLSRRGELHQDPMDTHAQHQLSVVEKVCVAALSIQLQASLDKTATVNQEVMDELMMGAEEAKVLGKEGRRALKTAEPISEAEAQQEVEESMRSLFDMWLSQSSMHSCVCCRQIKYRSNMVFFRTPQMELLDVKYFQRMSEDIVSDAHFCSVDNFHKAKTDIAEKYAQLKEEARASPGTHGDDPANPNAFVCKRCWGPLRKGHGPKMGSWNNLKPVGVPTHLGRLGPLGQALLAQRIVFMRILGLRAGGQKAVTGGIANVPTNFMDSLDKAWEAKKALPNGSGRARLLGIALKRQVAKGGTVHQQMIDVDDLFLALGELKAINRFYKSVSVLTKTEWRELMRKDDPELAQHLLWAQLEGEGAAVEGKTLAEVDAEGAGGEPLVLDGGEDEEEGNPLADFLIAKVNGPTVDPDEAQELGEGHQGATKTGKSKNLVLAPGEGQKPIPLFMDKHVEEKAHPAKFPTGENALDSERPLKISTSDYFKNRLMHEDPRWKSSMDYVFFGFHKLEYEKLVSSMCFSLRTATAKGKGGEGGPLTAAAVNDPLTLANFIANNDGYRFMKTARGAPAYWQSQMYDLLAMVKQLNSPTFFLTLSANDKEWPAVIGEAYKAKHGRLLTKTRLNALSGRDKNRLLQEFPDIAARQFDKRVQVMLRTLRSKFQPLGKISDHFVRVEWQDRGSPHIHALLWVEGAPVVGRETNAEVEAFADKFISCMAPDEKDKELWDLVHKVQFHSHRFTCQNKDIKVSMSAADKETLTAEQKKQKAQDDMCRFNYPKPEREKTSLIIPADVATVVEGLRAGTEAMKEEIESEVSRGNLTQAEGAAKTAEVEAAFLRERMEYLQTSPLELKMKRVEDGRFLNNYNPALLRSWRANMDIQFVTNAYAAITYICGYVAKAERRLSEEVKEAMASLPPGAPARIRMRKHVNAFIRSRKMSAQECFHNMCSLPYVRKSRRVLFVPTGFKEDRFRMLKSKVERQKLDPKSKDVFVAGLVEHYQARSSEGCKHSPAEQEALEKMPLAVFAAYYARPEKLAGGADGLGEGEDAEDAQPGGDHIDDQDLPVDASAAASLPQRINLPNTHAKMEKRKRKAIIRYHNFNAEKDPENFAYSHLLLFKPFRDEEVELDLQGSGYESYSDWLDAEMEQMLSLVSEFEGMRPLLSLAFERLAKHRKEEQEAMRRDLGEDADPDTDEPELDPENAFLDPGNAVTDQMEGLGDGVENGDLDSNAPQPVYTGSRENLQTELEAKLAQLNQGQRKAYAKVVERMDEYEAATKEGRVYNGKPLYIAGAGGCGKSFLLDAIRLGVHLRFHKELTDVTVVTTASTGTAATLIGGSTVHSALGISATRGGRAPTGKLSAQKKEILSTRFKDLACLIVDEVSMIGMSTFYMINSRLNEIMGFRGRDDSVIFGGIMTIFCGDLLQLRPVRAKSVYDPVPGRGMGPEASVMQLWREEVEMVELEELMRTKGDVAWGALLGRMRVGQLTDADVELLKSCTLSRRGLTLDSPQIAKLTRIFSTNPRVDTYNDEKIEELHAKKMAEGHSQSRLWVRAVDKMADAGQAKFFKGDLSLIVPEDVDRTGGLYPKLDLVLDMPVCLRQNVCVSEGLANGSLGQLKGWIWRRGDEPAPDCHYSSNLVKMPEYIFIHFAKIRGRHPGANYRAAFLKKNPHLTQLLNSMGPHVVPIPQFTAEFNDKNNKNRISRTQLPIARAFASTVHRVQGGTFDELVMSISGWMPAAAAYVAFSRLTSMDGLYLMDDFVPEKIKADGRALYELDRLRHAAGLPLKNIPGTVNPANSPFPDPYAAPAAPKAMPSEQSPASTTSAAPVLPPPPRASTSTPMARVTKKKALAKDVAAPAQQPTSTLVARLDSRSVAQGSGWCGTALGTGQGQKRDSRVAQLREDAPKRPAVSTDAAAQDIRLFLQRLRGNLGLGLMSLVAVTEENGDTFFNRVLPRMRAAVNREVVVGEAAEAAALLRELTPQPFSVRAEDSVQQALFPQFSVLKAARTTGDGSCFYYGLSLGLLGTEELGKLLRALCVFTFLRNEEFFLRMFRRTCAVTGENPVVQWEDVVRQARRPRGWGEDYNALALSAVLARDIWFVPSARYHHFYHRVCWPDGTQMEWMLKDPWGKRLVCESREQLRELLAMDEWELVGGVVTPERPDVGRWSLGRLREAYAADAPGLPRINCVPGTRLLPPAEPNRPPRAPLLLHFHGIHYTALLPTTPDAHTLLPQPLHSVWGPLNDLPTGTFDAVAFNSPALPV